MQNSISDQNNCPLSFSYVSFGNGYLVQSDLGSSLDEKLFNGSIGVTKLKQRCEGEDQCDHATCSYQQELVRALLATSSMIDPKQLY